MPVDLVRDAAIDVLLRVFEDRAYLERSLDKTLRRKPLSDRGRRFLAQVAYGVVRHRGLCDHVLVRLCHQPLEELPLPILTILRMGIFQALFCRQVTFPAMVHTSVDLAKRRGHAGTARLVNAVLRKAPHSIEEVRLPSREKNVASFLAVRYSAPDWLVKLWIDDFGEEEAESLLAASCEEAPACLRVNTLKTNETALLENLQRSGVAVKKCTEIPGELTLEAIGPALKSKWFQRGHFLFQDPASMLPPLLLEPQPGERVLDLCAAPGGKTTHMAQLMGDDGMVVAADRPWGRLGPLAENVARLETGCVRMVCADGTAPPFSGGFDRVLVDAPCSGLGTLRRHPDLKWRMNPEAIARLAEQQRALLRSALHLCKPGGVLVYSVCTFTRQETLDVVEPMAAEGLGRLEDGPEYLDQWKMSAGQYRILPSERALDGFFLTRFRKAS